MSDEKRHGEEDQTAAEERADGERTSIGSYLRSGRVYVGPFVGVSMRPMLRQGRDVVVVRPLAEGEKPRRLDVALYSRGEDYVLHRVLRVREGGYVCRGDNCAAKEWVTENCMLGVLTEFFHGEKRVKTTKKSYRVYSAVWVFLHPAVRICLFFRGLAAKIFRRLRGKKNDGEKNGSGEAL